MQTATHTIYRACNQAADTVMYHISGRWEKGGRRAEIQVSDFIDFNKPNILSPCCIFNLLHQGQHVSLVDHLSVYLPPRDLRVKLDETISWIVTLDLNGKLAEVPSKLHTPLTPPNSLWMLMNINECNSACHDRGHLVSSTYSMFWSKYCICFVSCVRWYFQNPNKQLNIEGGSPSRFLRHLASLTEQEKQPEPEWVPCEY